MPRTPSTANRNEVSFTVKLVPSQVQYLASLKGPLRVSSEQQVVREMLEWFRGWFRLPGYQRQVLEQDLRRKRSHIFEYLQELLARRFEELSAVNPEAPTPPAPRAIPSEAEEPAAFGIRIAPELLKYADELKPALQVAATGDVVRELVASLETWCRLPRYQADRLQQDMASRGLNVLEYFQEALARRYEAIRDEEVPERGRRR
jgi:hypothetical protein